MTLWRRLFGRGRLDRELDAELRDHLERRVADYLNEGLSEAEARRRASAGFGGLEQTKEYCRDQRGTRWLEDFATDARYGLRMLAHSRTFTLVAVLSLALGIGANTAIFTLVNSLLLQTLPVAEPERLVQLDGDSTTNPIWEQIQSRQQQLFAGATAWSEQGFDLAQGGEAKPIDGLWASGEFFEVLGVKAILGRTFTSENDRRGGGSESTVAVISHAFWQRQFSGAADVIGRSIALNKVPFTIIGVTPPEFMGPQIGRAFDVAVPLRTADVLDNSGGEQRLDGRSMWWLNITARLKPGQTAEQATAALRAVQPQIREATTPDNWPEEHLKEYLRDGFTLSTASQGPSYLRNQLQQPLVTIMIVVSLVLLVACANIANLMLARASGRRHELTMRLALGASRARLARQLLTESLLLSTLGALLGLAFARWGSALLVSQFSTSRDPLILDLSLDWRVLGFTAAIAVLTALLFGVAPAMTTRRLAPMDALKEQGRGRSGGRHRLASPLVVVQIALSLVLVVGAGLFMRTFASLATMPLGFDRDSVLLVELDVQRSQLPQERRADLYARLAEAAARVPGVERAATSLLTPVSGMGWNNAFEIPHQPNLSLRQRLAFLNAITPGWHSVYGTRVVAGREFTAGDREGSPHVAIVNQTYVKRFLRAGSGLGQVVQQSDGPGGAPRPPAAEIVGVVEDAAYRNLRDPMPPTVYLPMAQLPPNNVFPNGAVGVRAAAGSPALLVRGLSEALSAVDPDVSLSFKPLKDQVDARLVRERVLALLGGFFGALALLLAGVGLYGVTSYSVTLRRGEIGVRMALGADVSRVVRLVLGRAAWLVVFGVAIGTGLSLWLAKFVSALLFGLEARDLATLSAAVLLMAAVGTLAAFLPAWRAARIDPVEVLREG
jgi:putative ABC transport system permease protein